MRNVMSGEEYARDDERSPGDAANEAAESRLQRARMVDRSVAGTARQRQWRYTRSRGRRRGVRGVERSASRRNTLFKPTQVCREAYVRQGVDAAPVMAKVTRASVLN